MKHQQSVKRVTKPEPKKAPEQQPTTITIDPVDIFMDLPSMIILKNGSSVIKKSDVKVEIASQKCSVCGKLRGSHDTFVNGKCNTHWIQEDVKLPPLEVPEEDVMKLTGSSLLSEARYRPATKGSETGFLTLILDNVKKEQLIYIDVPRRTWLELCGAASVGKFYNQRIKGKFLQQLNNPQRDKEVVASE